jgi:hypothetical protein
MDSRAAQESIGRIVYLYVNEIKNNVQMTEPDKAERWEKIINSGTVMCQTFITSLADHPAAAELLANFVEVWRNSCKNLVNMPLIHQFYQEVFDLLDDASPELIGLIQANYKRYLPPTQAVTVLTQPVSEPVQQVIPVVAQDYPTFKANYLAMIPQAVANHTYIPENESTHWLLFLANNEAEMLYKTFNALPDNQDKLHIILLYLAHWAHQSHTISTIRDNLYRYYLSCLQVFKPKAPDAAEIALWHGLLRNNPDYIFGMDMFHAVLCRNANMAKVLLCVATWMEHFDTLELIHQAYSHGVKLDGVFELLNIHHYKDDIKEIAQVRGLEWFIKNPTIVVKPSTKAWFSDTKQQSHIIHLVEKGHVDEAKVELDKYKESVVTKIDKHMHEDKQEDLKSYHFRF